MDELAVIRTFRPIPPPDAHAAAAARDALLAAVTARSRRLTRPRVLLACAIAVAVGATAASASGLGERLFDFVAGEPAPSPVKRQFDLMTRRNSVVAWLEQDPRSRAIASEARGVLAIQTSVGPVYLWVAPTRGGGFCHLIDIEANTQPDGSPGGGGGCRPLAPSTDEPFVSGPAQGGTLTPRGRVRLLDGRVGANVTLVELRFAAGDTATLRPVDGFFLRELTRDEHLVAVIARAEDGTELARRTMRGPMHAPRAIPKPVGPYRTVIEIDTSWGYPMTFAVAPGADGTVCTQTRYRRARSGGCNRAPRDPEAIWVGHALWNEAGDDKPVIVLDGSVGRSIVRLELEYRDGGRAQIPIVESYVLFELGRDRAPARLVGYDADGSVIARRLLR
jgi:hypothetical protein